MSKALSVRVTDELALKLPEIAKETERPKSFHVQKALEAYLAAACTFGKAHNPGTLRFIKLKPHLQPVRQNFWIHID